MAPVTASAAPGTRRAAAMTSPGRSNVLLGMQPQYEHSPPTRRCSTRATDRPPSAQRPAAFSPAGPAPITMTSYVSAIAPSPGTLGWPHGDADNRRPQAADIGD